MARLAPAQRAERLAPKPQRLRLVSLQVSQQLTSLEQPLDQVCSQKTSKRAPHSSDSSSESEEARPLTKQKQLMRRGRRRLRQYLDEVMDAQSQGLTLLEKKAVQSRTETYYMAEFNQVKAFAQKMRQNLSHAAGMDGALCQYMTAKFLEGHPAHRGDKLMAAVCHLRAAYGRRGPKSLPRANRALKGWRRLAPGHSRKAFPLAVWAAVCVEMARLRQLRMALFTILGLASYARPSELLACKVFSLVPPTRQVTDRWSLLLCAEELGRPSKTQEFDDSVLLDTPYLLPWAPVLLKELRAQPMDRPLWDFSYSDYFHVFSQIAKTLKLEVTPYHLRHSGPSIDRSRNIRSLLEVQKRGRWKSHKSVTRYERAARLAANFRELPVAIQRHCLHAESVLGDVMLGRTCPPVPP